MADSSFGDLLLTRERGSSVAASARCERKCDNRGDYLSLGDAMAPLILTACGGFLLAVLWMDLLFDTQVLRQRSGDLPEDVLASIAAYYRRVTTTSRPMGRLVALVMLTT